MQRSVGGSGMGAGGRRRRCGLVGARGILTDRYRGSQEFADSQSSFSFIRDNGVDAWKVHPVGAGINLPYVREVKEKSYDAPRVLFVGKDFELKGGRFLLDAFAPCGVRSPTPS